MSKYIDADKAFETITDFAGRAETKGIYAAYWKSAKAVKKMPAADVRPVVHAHWEVDEFGHKCSVCGEYVMGETYENECLTYCLNCGACMDEEA